VATPERPPFPGPSRREGSCPPEQNGTRACEPADTAPKVSVRSGQVKDLQPVLGRRKSERDRPGAAHDGDESGRREGPEPPGPADGEASPGLSGLTIPPGRRAGS
jgi:hypothetical protein